MVPANTFEFFDNMILAQDDQGGWHHLYERHYNQGRALDPEESKACPYGQKEMEVIG